MAMTSFPTGLKVDELMRCVAAIGKYSSLLAS